MAPPTKFFHGQFSPRGIDALSNELLLMIFGALVPADREVIIWKSAQSRIEGRFRAGRYNFHGTVENEDAESVYALFTCLETCRMFRSLILGWWIPQITFAFVGTVSAAVFLELIDPNVLEMISNIRIFGPAHAEEAMLFRLLVEMPNILHIHFGPRLWIGRSAGWRMDRDKLFADFFLNYAEEFIEHYATPEDPKAALESLSFDDDLLEVEAATPDKRRPTYACGGKRLMRLIRHRMDTREERAGIDYESENKWKRLARKDAEAKAIEEAMNRETPEPEELAQELPEELTEV